MGLTMGTDGAALGLTSKSVALALAVASFAAPQPAAAQSDFPNQKIMIYSGLAAGGGADLITRHYAAKLQEMSGQSVVVVNRPGAGGNLGAAAVANAKPDGYTLLVAPNVAFAGNLYLYKDVPYHPIKSFTPVTTLASLPFIFAVPPNSPVNSVKDLIEYIKAKDGKATYAGNTTTAIMGIEYILQSHRHEDDARAVQVAGRRHSGYRRGHGRPRFRRRDVHAEPGQGRPRQADCPSSTAERSPSVPNLPTMRESGFDDFDITAWFAAYAPAGTPPDAIAKLEGWLNKAVTSPETKATSLPPSATDPMPGTFGKTRAS